MEIGVLVAEGAFAIDITADRARASAWESLCKCTRLFTAADDVRR